MPVETVIHTIRHGHTDYNAEKRYAGSIDIPLSEKGVQDCQKAALRLENHHFDVVVTSTMKRSIDTAQIMVGAKVPIVQSPLCNERNFGVMEGLTWEDVLKMEPPVLMIDVGNDLHTVNPPGSEPFEDVWQRAKKFRRFLFRNYAGENILIVSHGVFLQMLHGLLGGKSCIESLAYYPANLELASFTFHGRQLVNEKTEKLTYPEVEVKF